MEQTRPHGPVQRAAQILSNHRLSDVCYQLTLHAPEAAQRCVPGQFAMVSLSERGVPYVRRPFAIAWSDDANCIQLVYEVAGKGTSLLSRMEPGGILGLIAPLGNGFDLALAKRSALLVAGGVGVSSLMELARTLSLGGCALTAVLGAQSKGGLVRQDAFEALGARTVVCTDDGSAGDRCNPADAVRALLQKQAAFDAAYVCGPDPMMRAVSEAVRSAHIPCQVSLERCMGCGFGVCMGCSVRVWGKDGIQQKRVCREGPVFHAQEVIWNG